MESYEDRINYVNKYETDDWSPDHLFTCNARLIIRKTPSIGEHFANVMEAMKFSKNHLGKIQRNWFDDTDNIQIITNAIYMPDISFLMKYKITTGNNEYLSDNGCFERLEIHQTNSN